MWVACGKMDVNIGCTSYPSVTVSTDVGFIADFSTVRIACILATIPSGLLWSSGKRTTVVFLDGPDVLADDARATHACL
jgi:hypothetical protein